MKLTKTLSVFAIVLFVSSNLANAQPTVKNLDAKIVTLVKQAKIPQMQLSYCDKTLKYDIGVLNSDFLNSKAEAKVWRDDSTSIFQAASLSKVVFTYIVLKMYQRGEIDLDKPLYLYTDIDRFVDKEQAKKITARIVLKHRSGLPDWCASPSSEAWPTSPIKFKYPVDSCFNYSGEAMAFLQRAVEAIKGEPIQKIAEREVFVPLHMQHTAYEWLPCYDQMAVCGYNSNGENRGKRESLRANVAYTLRTNAVEYGRFLDELFCGETLSASTKKLMFDPDHNRAIGEPAENRACDKVMYWGMSIGIEMNKNHGKVLWHWGDNGNFKALFVYIPREYKRLLYFTNSANGHDIINQLTSIFFKDDEPFAISDWIVGQ